MSDPITYEEGEILEDGEIADDDCDTGPPQTTSCPVQTKATTGPPTSTSQLTSANKSPQKMHLGARNMDSFEKENHENSNENYSEHSFGSTSTEREDRTDSVAKGRRVPRKRKRSQSRETNFNKKRNGAKLDPDITQFLEASEFDSSRLPESKQLNFDNLDFDMFFDVFKVTVKRDFLRTLKDSERKDMMLRILKICKQRAHTANDFKRKFGRLKKLAAQQSRVSKNKYKTPCKFFLDGKCHKGVHCTFSHECEIPKKEDICKFYIQGTCGADCYRNTNCRFSHAPLDEKSKQILDNYLKNNSRDDWKNGPNTGEVRPNDYPMDPNNPGHLSSDSVCDEDKHFGRHNEFDNYDYAPSGDEPFSINKERRAILGPVPERLRQSYRTWRWQQDCLEMKDDYKGNKQNLFNIENPFVVVNKPPPSDDEEDQEAIINYYSRQPLSEDDLDELRCVREIEEHQRAEERLLEEERAMAAAAALDFDLRKRTRDQPYVIPPVFGIDMSFLKKLHENAPLPELPQYAPPPPPPPPPPPQPPQPPATSLTMQAHSFGSPLPHLNQSSQNFVPSNAPQFMPQAHSSVVQQEQPLFRDPRFLKDTTWPPSHDPRSGPRVDGPPEVLDPRIQDPRADPRCHQDSRPKNDPRLPNSAVQLSPSCLLDPTLLELQAPSSFNDPRLISADPRTSDPRLADPRLNDSRTAIPKLNDPRIADPRFNQDPRSFPTDSRLNGTRNADARSNDPRILTEHRATDPRTTDPRVNDLTRSLDFRTNQDPRSLDPRSADARINDPRAVESPLNDPRVNRFLKNSPPLSLKREHSMEESLLTKRPFTKVHSQTLAPYRLKPAIGSRIDYRSYEELFRTDSSCKADPRLQNFFKALISSEEPKEIKKEDKSPEKFIDLFSSSNNSPTVSVNKSQLFGEQAISVEPKTSAKLDAPEPKSEAEPPAPPETVPNFSQIIDESVSSSTSTSTASEIPFYARGLLSKTVAPTFSTSSGLLTNLMTGTSLPSMIAQFSPPVLEKEKQVPPAEDNDVDSDAEPDLVIASEYD